MRQCNAASVKLMTIISCLNRLSRCLSLAASELTLIDYKPCSKCVKEDRRLSILGCRQKANNMFALPQGWNLSSLDSLLTRGLKKRIPGVNTSYLYFGVWRSFFGWQASRIQIPQLERDKCSFERERIILTLREFDLRISGFMDFCWQPSTFETNHLLPDQAT